MERHRGVAGGKGVFEAAIETLPDVAIPEFSLPRMAESEVGRVISSRLRETLVLIFTIHESRILAKEAFQAGTHVCLVKSDANKLLPTAAAALIAHSPLADRLFRGRSSREPGDASEEDQESAPRERFVAAFVAEGCGNTDIRAVLNLSVKTTEVHRALAVRKLEVFACERSTADEPIG
ncbi:LuxR C-terminal-related transcriptional regulator [Bradyrhizobium sp. 41S5]|uniref:LuxR C-terminal-related transcriptional regulator n=1 Tax=Bradyrhizobium sp. 41S5 TaxID=1404443 RepID=UPI001E39A3C4|nr:LuxR C-terminal-related transcriptional regulator [Bradyrhizobium sp. 41S5]UFX48285.1 LuxR C-terminal-related transcriptional regulator [Bradyrhizobium sp. 41S5]